MAYMQSLRSGCKDVFNSYLVSDATYDGELEIPNLSATNDIPESLIPFSQALNSTKYSSWIHFYEDDVRFDRIWKEPKRYLPIIKKFAGAITPDFSLYRDMPLVMQHWNIYRNRSIGHWLQTNNIPTIPNLRWADNRTYATCCLGIPQNSTIAVSTHGCIKHTIDRRLFIEGLDHVIAAVNPQVIIVHGRAPLQIFGLYEASGIKVIQFDSAFAQAHESVKGGH